MNQVTLEKWLIPGLGLEKYNTSLEHFAVPESEECSKNDGGMSKKIQEPGWKGSHWPNWDNLSLKIRSDSNRSITFHTCHVNPMGHLAGVNSPSHQGGEPWFQALVEAPGKGWSLAGWSSHLLGSFVSVPVFVHVQMAPSLSGLLCILFGKLLAVWDCIYSCASVQRHVNELVNSTEQLIKLFFNVLGTVLSTRGRYETRPGVGAGGLYL